MQTFYERMGKAQEQEITELLWLDRIRTASSDQIEVLQASALAWLVWE